MFKKIGIYVVAFIIGVMISFGINAIANNMTAYYVDQYDFGDGYKVTIDWNQKQDSEYDNVPYYYGCVNDGQHIQFWWTDATTWHRWLNDHNEDYKLYKKTVKEWRW